MLEMIPVGFCYVLLYVLSEHLGIVETRVWQVDDICSWVGGAVKLYERTFCDNRTFPNE